MATAASWASVAVTLILGGAGFVVARNVNTDFSRRLAERRLAGPCFFVNCDNRQGAAPWRHRR